MFARALIVLLLVLNLGVAIWWALRPVALPPSASARSTAGPRLQLLREMPKTAHAGAASVPPAAPAPDATATPAAAQRCFTLGPFADTTALTRARALLQPQVTQLRVRETTATGHGWRVWLPPLVDRAAAEAMVARIVAGGFKDYYIVPNGGETNSIALGRYGNEAAAQSRQSTLQAGGFPARVQALGGTAVWVDVMATIAFDVEAMRKRIGAPQARPTECTDLH